LWRDLRHRRQRRRRRPGRPRCHRCPRPSQILRCPRRCRRRDRWSCPLPLSRGLLWSPLRRCSSSRYLSGPSRLSQRRLRQLLLTEGSPWHRQASLRSWPQGRRRQRCRHRRHQCRLQPMACLAPMHSFQRLRLATAIVMRPTLRWPRPVRWRRAPPPRWQRANWCQWRQARRCRQRRSCLRRCRHRHRSTSGSERVGPAVSPPLKAFAFHIHGC